MVPPPAAPPLEPAPIPQDYAPLAGSEYRSSSARVSTLLGPADPDEMAKVVILLRRRPDGPPMPDLGHFMKTPPWRRPPVGREAFEAKYGAAPADIEQVRAFARSRGLTVVEISPARRTVIVSGTVAQLSAAFAVRLGRYVQLAPRRNGKPPRPRFYRGREGVIHLPKALSGIVLGVFGLDTRPITKPNGGPADPPATQPILTSQVKSLYGVPAGTVANIQNQTIAILAPTGGAGGFFPTDMTACLGASAPQPVAISVDGTTNNSAKATTVGTAAAQQSDITIQAVEGVVTLYAEVEGPDIGATTAYVVGISGDTITIGQYEAGAYSPALLQMPIGPNEPLYFDVDSETTQDIQIAGLVASGANLSVYFSGADEAGWLAAVNRVVHPDPGDLSPTVMSSSYTVAFGDDPAGIWTYDGITVGFIQALDAAYQDAALMGVTACAGTGDYGSSGEVGDQYAHVGYPQSDPWVLSVGGTTIGKDTQYQSLQPPWVEYVWNDGAVSGLAPWGVTGGGLSDFFPAPPYQAGINTLTSVNLTINANAPFNKTGRGLPDVAANASLISGYQDLVLGGATFQGNGTSASGPFWAGLIAVLNARLGFNVGFVNPTLYAIGSGVGGADVFNPINPLNPTTGPSGCPSNNSDAGIAGYPATPGWDACTGWGSPNFGKLLSAIQNAQVKDAFFIQDWSVFDQAGVTVNPSASPAFSLVVDGFTPAELGVGTASPVVPSFTFSPGVTEISAPQLVSGPTPNGTPTIPGGPQRFTYVYALNFTGTADFPTPPTETKTIQLNATIQGVSAFCTFELTDQSAPYMVPGSTTWLSNDIRVFQAGPDNPPPWAGPLGLIVPNSGNPTNDATRYIQSVLASLASNPSAFDGIPAGETASELFNAQFAPGANPPSPIYDFAVARVWYQDPGEQAQSVRAFFRAFPALSISTAYEPATYARWSDGVEFGHTVPLLGSQTVGGQDYVTIPFFAEPRVDATTVSMDTQTDAPNIQTIPAVTGSAPSTTFFGCWLDINQPEQTPFPANPVGAGPFTGPTVSILSMLGSLHQCLTVEIAFDPVPIPLGATPGSSGMLGQRNLAIGPVVNPGHPASRAVSTPFELRSTPVELDAGARPDELMINWGEVPEGSEATLYLPGVQAREMIEEAQSLYGLVALTLDDPHTLRFAARGITYLPIPKHGGANLAGLLTLELPYGIKKGQAFMVIAQQVASAPEPNALARDEGGPRAPTRTRPQPRKVIGGFQLGVPVMDKSEILPTEERSLALARWIELNSVHSEAWRQVLARHVAHTAARVDALGGEEWRIPPSAGGLTPFRRGPASPTRPGPPEP